MRMWSDWGANDWKGGDVMEKYDCEGYDREGKSMYGAFVEVSDIVDALAVKRAFAIDAKNELMVSTLSSLIEELQR